MANLYNSAEEGVDTNDVLSFPTTLKGSEPRRRIEDFFCQDGHGVMNVDFLSGRIFGVSDTCSGDHSVHDGCVDTVTCCTHIFLLRARSLLMRVTYTHGSSS